MARAKEKKVMKKIALERIDILMEEAGKVFSTDPGRADRYAGLAKKIAMRHSIPMPLKWKRRICKRCSSFLMPGSSSIVRTQRGALSILCTRCRSRVRIPYK